jgi:hypothetical protein
MSPTETLAALHDSEINFRLDVQYDSMWNWTIRGRNGALAGGIANNIVQAAKQMAEAATQHFPKSDFARRMAQATPTKEQK